jgi:NRPS condensation-like uncharacterized protein
MYLARQLHDAQGRCMMTFDQAVNENRLSRALLLTMEAEPVLASRFVVHPWRPYWLRRDDLERISQVEVSASTDAKQDGLQYLAGPLDPELDPQIRLKVFRGHKDVLCLKLNHMVTDGSGFLDYIVLLGRTYRELGKNPDYRLSYAGAASRGQWQIVRRVRLRRLLQAGFAFKLPTAGWNLPATKLDCSNPTLLVHQLPERGLANLKSYCRQNRAGMNVVLHAAFFRALCLLLDPPFDKKLSIQTTVNLRQHLPPGYVTRICNLAGIFFLNLPRIREESFAATLARMQALFDQAREEQPWLGGAIALEGGLLAGFIFSELIFKNYQKRMRTLGAIQPILANLGNIHSEKIDFGDNTISDLAIIGPIPYSSAALLSVYSFNGAMNLTAGVCPAATDPTAMTRFLDLFIAELSL